jgi:hypothetical protein
MLKKIEVQLLLADFALQLADARSRSGQFLLRCLLGRPRQWRRCRTCLWWRLNLIRHVQPTQPTQRLSTALQILRAPMVKRLARRPNLPGQRWHVLAGQHALHSRHLHLTTVSSSRAFRHQLSLPSCHLIPVSLLGCIPSRAFSLVAFDHVEDRIEQGIGSIAVILTVNLPRRDLPVRH